MKPLPALPVFHRAADWRLARRPPSPHTLLPSMPETHPSLTAWPTAARLIAQWLDRKERIDAIMDICAKPDIVWAMWSNGQDVIKGQKLVAMAAAKTSWIAIPCADKAEAAYLERKLA